MKRLFASALLAMALLLGMTPTAFAASAFTDVPDTHWASSYIQRAYEKGWVNGMSQTIYAPSDSLTRAQFLKMMATAFYSADLQTAEGANAGAWYAPSWTVAQKYGLEKGTNMTKLSDLTAQISRYDMAQVIVNVAVSKGVDIDTTDRDDEIRDWNSIPRNYWDAVSASYTMGVLNGKNGGVFAGQDTMTRAEAATVLCRMDTVVTGGSGSSGGSGSQKPTTQKPNTQKPQTPGTQQPPAPQTQTPQELAAEVVRLVNVERAKEGLPALGTFDSLTKSAEIRAPETAKLFSHDRPDGSSCFTALDATGASKGAYTSGENIAAGSSTAADVVEQWMNSPGHRANILNKDFTHIGVGYSKSNSGYGHYWVQMFVGTKNVPDSGSTQNPGTQNPDTQKPGTQNPGTQKPGTQTPGTQTPGTQKPGTQKPGTQAPQQTPQELAAEVVRLVNVERAKEGLPALGTFDSLTKSAEIRAPETAKLFSHDRPDGSSCFTALDATGASKGAYTSGENIAAGSSTAADVVEQWMNSPGHRANILNKDFTHIGVAYCKSSSGYGHYWVQMFVGAKSVPDSGSTQTPGTQNPGTQTPGAQKPGTQNPGTQNPDTQTPGTQNPGTQYPGPNPSDDLLHSSTYLAKKLALSCLARYNMPSDSFSTTELYIYSTSDFYGKDYTVSWSVDNPDILALEEITSKSGNPAVRFYGLGVAGKARITCTVTATDGMTATQFCDVTVVDD